MHQALVSVSLPNSSHARDLRPEWMDQPELDADLHRQALAGLARINWWSRTDAALWTRLRKTASAVSPLRVLDIACGGGDVVQTLARRARRAGLSFHWTGCDASPVALEVARRNAVAAGLSEIRYEQRNVLDGPLPECDVAICTLFLHHLTMPEARRLMQRLSTIAGRLVLIDDLVRTRTGYLLAWCGGRILSRSPVVHADGPQSVRAAFSVSELKQMAEEAGLAGATIERHWPERMLLAWERPQ